MLLYRSVLFASGKWYGRNFRTAGRKITFAAMIYFWIISRHDRQLCGADCFPEVFGWVLWIIQTALLWRWQYGVSDTVTWTSLAWRLTHKILKVLLLTVRYLQVTFRLLAFKQQNQWNDFKFHLFLSLLTSKAISYQRNLVYIWPMFTYRRKYKHGECIPVSRYVNKSNYTHGK